MAPSSPVGLGAPSSQIALGGSGARSPSSRPRVGGEAPRLGGGERGRVARRAVALALPLALAAAAAWHVERVLPADGEVAAGVRLGGVAVPAGVRAEDAAREAARARLERPVVLRYPGEAPIQTSLRDLGGVIDEARIAAALDAVGRRGSIFERLDDAREAREGRIAVAVPVALPVETLAERLERLKDARDRHPKNARYDFEAKGRFAHAPGVYVDVYAAAEALGRLAEPAPPAGADEAPPVALDLPVARFAPRASTEFVAGLDVGRVAARFETRFGFRGSQAGRAKNVARAAEGIDGLVLMPGEVVSFNEAVGPRSLENGFAHAPEIFKGEMRDGVGGGTCQVASTLHAAAFFGGLEIVERANHSRPSGYIPLGLDATVVYPVVDFKVRNPYEFPMVVKARVHEGQLVVELLGRARPATVELSTETLKVTPFKRKIEDAAWLAEGSFKLKQKGIQGYSIRKTRKIAATGGERVEVTTDVYPATFEIYLVPPGAEPAELLPPIPEGGEADEGEDETADGASDAAESVRG